MKNIVCTGASGFIGQYFIQKYTTDYEIQSFSFLREKLEALNLKNIDVVLHLSALVHQMGGASADEYEKVNVMQTLALAKKAKASGVGHFIFMSTVKVYGEETEDKYAENSVCHPEDEYGKSKLKAEKELLKLEDENFKVSIIRTPIVYGYGVKANIKSLVNLVNKVSLLPFGRIDNKRSMVYIGNLCYLVDAVISSGCAALAAPSEEKGETKVTHPGNVFLACDNEPISTSRLVELIAKNLDKKVYLIKVPFFETFLKLVKPSFYKRLYGSLEVDNTQTMQRLFGEAKASLPYSVEDGIKLMLNSKF